MTREQFDELYKNKAVWCKTEALAIEFLKLANSVGYTWQSYMSLLTRTNWAKYLGETVYVVENTKEFVSASVSYGNRLFAKEINIPIVEFGATPLPTNQPKGMQFELYFASEYQRTYKTIAIETLQDLQDLQKKYLSPLIVDFTKQQIIVYDDCIE